MKANLIKTKDQETVNKLVSLGFTLVSEDSGVYTFLNDKPLNFAELGLKVTFSNRLNL